MEYLRKPFTNEKNQVVFCGLGLFLATNIGPLFNGNTFLLRIFIYPLYLLLLLNFIYLLFCIRQNRHNINSTVYNVFWLLILLGIICIVRGMSMQIDINIIRSLLFNRLSSAIVWLMPLALLYGLKQEFWLTWMPRMQMIIGVGIVYVLLIIAGGVIKKYSMYSSADLLFLSPFLIIFSVYKPNKLNIFTGCIGIIALSALMFLADERFAIAYTGLICMFYIISIIFEKQLLNFKIFVIVTGIILLLSSFFIATRLPVFQSYINRYFIQGEMWKDTRGELGTSVTDEMSLTELILGKGINGTYMGLFRVGEDRWERSTIEIGYKLIWLKGGIVMLACFYSVSAAAVFFGLFRSRNKITRYLAYIIIARLIIMSTAMYPRVSFEYFMYWVVVGGCLSVPLRSLDDETIKNKCQTRKLVVRW